MDTYTKTQVQSGASAPLLVPKPFADRWRFTGDLRPVNQYTIPFQYPMPIIDHELQKLQG